MRRHLVRDYRNSWRWLSIRLAALITALPVVWVAIPDDLRDWVPEELRPWIVGIMGLAVIFGRLYNEGDPDA